MIQSSTVLASYLSIQLYMDQLSSTLIDIVVILLATTILRWRRNKPRAREEALSLDSRFRVVRNDPVSHLASWIAKFHSPGTWVEKRGGRRSEAS